MCIRDSDKPVLVNCFVYTPDIVVVMDETIIQKHVDVSKGCLLYTSRCVEETGNGIPCSARKKIRICTTA